MMLPFERRALTMVSRIPERLARPRRSEWADLNLAGREIGFFLEGPAFDARGDLFLVDIPFGRIFRVDRDREWHLVAEYDGWPNGLKVLADGKLLIADHKRGLLRLDPATGRHSVLLDAVDGAPLLGLNDLFVMPDGTIYLTDQGQTGLHDPRGRVIRIAPSGTAETVLDGGPSPNGVVADIARSCLYVAMTRGNAVWRVPLVDGRATKVGIAIQLTGGIGPDGLAFDRHGRLLVAQAPFGVWRFDARNWPRTLFEAPDEDAYLTNLAVRQEGTATRMVVTDSIAGRLLGASLED